jgi:hypothetical protein
VTRGLENSLECQAVDLAVTILESSCCSARRPAGEGNND